MSLLKFILDACISFFFNIEEIIRFLGLAGFKTDTFINNYLTIFLDFAKILFKQTFNLNNNNTQIHKILKVVFHFHNVVGKETEN